MQACWPGVVILPMKARGLKKLPVQDNLQLMDDDLQPDPLNHDWRWDIQEWCKTSQSASNSMGSYSQPHQSVDQASESGNMHVVGGLWPHRRPLLPRQPHLPLPRTPFSAVYSVHHYHLQDRPCMSLALGARLRDGYQTQNGKANQMWKSGVDDLSGWSDFTCHDA